MLTPSGDVLESDESDNCTAGAAATAYDRPDLSVLSLTASATAIAGDTVSVSWTVRNIGAAPPCLTGSTRVYLSLDDHVGSDVLVYTEAYASVWVTVTSTR